MKQHKWHKEIKAWADGAEIEHRWIGDKDWSDAKNPVWASKVVDFRIKQQPVEPQYLYVYWNKDKEDYDFDECGTKEYDFLSLIGKIPLIVESNDD